MIGYVTLGTNDLEAAVEFYDELMAEFGAGRWMETDRIVAWSAGEGQPGLAVTHPHDGKSATVGNGTMVGLAADGPERVDRIHALALELGGRDEGAPGPRGEGFYAGYFRDLDGNKLNIFYSGS